MNTSEVAEKELGREKETVLPVTARVTSVVDVVRGYLRFYRGCVFQERGGCEGRGGESGEMHNSQTRDALSESQAGYVLHST